MDELNMAIALAKDNTSLQLARIPNDDGSKVLRACGNLVVRNSVDDTVRLAHHIVRQLILLHYEDVARTL